MTRLYICEKPSQARDLAAVLGVSRRAEGYLDGGDQVVTWALGHLLEMKAPDAYDERYKRWSLDDLPIAPGDWKLGVTSRGRGQFKAIKTLLGKDSSVVIATDADREGEMIALVIAKKRQPRAWVEVRESAEFESCGTPQRRSYCPRQDRCERLHRFVGIDARRRVKCRVHRLSPRGPSNSRTVPLFNGGQSGARTVYLAPPPMPWAGCVRSNLEDVNNGDKSARLFRDIGRTSAKRCSP